MQLTIQSAGTRMWSATSTPSSPSPPPAAAAAAAAAIAAAAAASAAAAAPGVAAAAWTGEKQHERQQRLQLEQQIYLIAEGQCTIRRIMAGDHGKSPTAVSTVA